MLIRIESYGYPFGDKSKSYKDILKEECVKTTLEKDIDLKKVLSNKPAVKNAIIHSIRNIIADQIHAHNKANRCCIYVDVAHKDKTIKAYSFVEELTSSRTIDTILRLKLPELLEEELKEQKEKLKSVIRTNI